MHNIFISTKKIIGALRTCDDGSQNAPKGANILNHVDINEDVAQKIPKSLQDQHNFDGSIPKVSKDPNLPLTIGYKKTIVNGKLDKKHKMVLLH
jgi:hypothetical protein